MYAINQTKMPPVRPRSSLSTDEHHYRSRDCDVRRCRKKPNNAMLTLLGLVLVLFVLCAFLLGALIYVGRNIVNETALTAAITSTATTTDAVTGINLTDSQLLSPTQFSILRIRTTTDLSPAVTVTRSASIPKNMTVFAIEPAVAAASKVLKQLTMRLPKEIKPVKYQLRLKPDLVNKLYAGNMTIKLKVLQPISFIPVHVKNLTVNTDAVVQLNDTGAPIGKLEPSLTFAHKEFEYWVTEFKEPLNVGQYLLELSFNGSLTDKNSGFYASSYLNKTTNQRRWIATSKFEPTYARLAFPCFDEPAMKAMFTITVVRPTGDGYHALSNMNVENEVVNGDETEVIFAESVPMSTYLACIIVSDFKYESQMVRGILENADDFEMRVYSTANQVNKVKYALEAGVGITEYYISYFNVPYPLPKLDMAAIPDFVSGAMEHWGLVTFRETALLYDPTISSSADKQRVATVVAHELAHMWFGNLVTMKWWNDLWLNEGFATYIEYKGVNKMHPEWDMLDQFLHEDLHSVMSLDATLASHPIVQVVESPAQITELFDSITYSKGASIIRMLEDLVGADKFQNATTKYLNNFMYTNAETNDFLAQIEEEELEFDVTLIMKTWTEQMGLPVVEVTKDGNSYKLTQKRFLSNPSDYNASFENSNFNYRWSIPITYFTSSSDEVQRTIFNYNDNEITLNVGSAVDWIKLNKNQVGYYRVNYPTNIWKALTNTLINTRGKFSNADRAHLINDVFSLADASQLEYTLALDLSLYLENELDYVPWRVAKSHLDNLKNLLYYTDSYRDFVIYGRKLVTNAYESVKWDVGTDHLQNLLRVKILGLSCDFGYNTALAEAATRFKTWLSNSSERPNPDIRSIVYYFGMKEVGDEESWNQVWELFINEADAQEKVKLMEALAAIQVPWILQYYINLAWNETYVRRQDYFNCLQLISNNRIGESLVWDYVRENWQRLVDRYGINERYLGRLIPGITKRFTTKTKLEEMEAFFAKYPEAGAGTAARKQALETVKYNIKWLEDNKQQVAEWLAAQQSEKGETTTVANSI